jgi:hypothetical protein
MNVHDMDITVRGDANAVDSFTACFAAVAAYFGLRSDYAYLEALSGTCFSPCHNRGEDCIGWKMDGGNAARVDFMAQAVGLSVERIDLAPGALDGWEQTYALSRVLPEQVAGYFARLRQAGELGSLIILPTWPAWSVLTGWADDLSELPYATLPGFTETVAQIWPPLKTRFAFTIKQEGPASDPAETTRQALAYAAQIASGEVVPVMSGFGDQNYFGGEMYGIILQQLEQPFLCSGCGENGCFSRAVRRIHDGHNASAAFLREVQPLVGNGGIAHLAARYEALAGISGGWVQKTQRNWTVFDDESLRPALQADFTTMQQIHQEVAALFKVNGW